MASLSRPYQTDRTTNTESTMHEVNLALHSPSRHAPTEHNRAEVARGSIGAVVHVAKLMPDDPVLMCSTSAAIYNFVSRQGGSICFFAVHPFTASTANKAGLQRLPVD